MNTSHRPGLVGLLALSSAAATIAMLSGCGSSDQGTDTSVPTTTPVSSSPATSLAPTSNPGSPVAPSSTGQAPASSAPTTQGGSTGPSQTVSGGNSVAPTSVQTQSPPTGKSMPGDNAGPQGNPGSPGRN